MRWTAFPELTSHTIRLVSSDPDTIRVPSGLNATSNTPAVCPSKCRAISPVSRSHNTSEPSHVPPSTNRPSGLNATADTRASSSLKRRNTPPVATFQRITVLPLVLGVSACCPSAFSASSSPSDNSELSMPSGVARCSVSSACRTMRRSPMSQIRRYPVLWAEITCGLPGTNATCNAPPASPAYVCSKSPEATSQSARL